MDYAYLIDGNLYLILQNNFISIPMTPDNMARYNITQEDLSYLTGEPQSISIKLELER